MIDSTTYARALNRDNFAQGSPFARSEWEFKILKRLAGIEKWDSAVERTSATIHSTWLARVT